MTTRPQRAISYLILVLFGFNALYPIMKLVVMALSPDQSGTSSGIISNFTTAWTDGHFSTSMLNSLAVSAFVVVVAVAASVCAGYAFGTMTFRGSRVLFYVFFLGIMIPAETIVIPLYIDMRSLGLTETFWAVAMPQCAMSIAFGTYWMRTYFRSSNRSISEAARLDGAGPFGVLWRIQLPIARPALITLIVLVFMWTWNEFLIPLVMSPNQTWATAPLGLSMFKGQYVTATSLLAAAAMIVALPVVIVYLFLQRHFIRGMIEGAVKD